MKKLGAAVVGLLLAMQSACVTVTDDDPPVKVSLDDAARANVALGANYLQKGDLNMAREKLEKAADQDPKLPEARVYLALLYERINEPKKAKENYRAAVRLAPGNPDVDNAYGGYLCRHDERREGIKYFVKAGGNALYRTPEVAYTNAAVCAMGIPDLVAAEEFLRKALDANPRYRAALLQLAMLSYDTDRAMQARAFLERFHSAGPATRESLNLGVRVETALGNSAAAEEYQQRLQAEFPDSAALSPNFPGLT